MDRDQTTGTVNYQLPSTVTTAQSTAESIWTWLGSSPLWSIRLCSLRADSESGKLSQFSTINFLQVSLLHNQQLNPLQHDWEGRSQKFTARKYNDFAFCNVQLTTPFNKMSLLHNQQLISLYPSDVPHLVTQIHPRTQAWIYLCVSKYSVGWAWV